MIARLFFGLGRDASLVAEFGATVFEFVAVVVGFANLFEVGFDHVNVLLVLFVANAGVPHNADAEFVERLSHFATLQFPLAFFLLEKGLEVNNGDFGQVEVVFLGDFRGTLRKIFHRAGGFVLEGGSLLVGLGLSHSCFVLRVVDNQ